MIIVIRPRPGEVQSNLQLAVGVALPLRWETVEYWSQPITIAWLEVPDDLVLDAIGAVREIFRDSEFLVLPPGSEAEFRAQPYWFRAGCTVSWRSSDPSKWTDETALCLARKYPYASSVVIHDKSGALRWFVRNGLLHRSVYGSCSAFALPLCPGSEGSSAPAVRVRPRISYPPPVPASYPPRPPKIRIPAPDAPVAVDVPDLFQVPWVFCRERGLKTCAAPGPVPIARQRSERRSALRDDRSRLRSIKRRLKAAKTDRRETKPHRFNTCRS